MQNLSRALATAAIWAAMYFLSDKQPGYFGWLLFVAFLSTCAVWND